MREAHKQFFAILATCGLLSACTDTNPDWQISGQTMGTRYSVTVANCPVDACTDELAGQLASTLEDVNRQMSHFDSESELSRFNRHNTTDWVAVSSELATVVQLALSISELSDGAFDITVAAAANAWGFGPQEAEYSRPTDATIQQALAHSGWQKLGARDNPPALRKTDPQLSMDLSAIAKGFAVDQLAYFLEFNGIANYLVEIGGEIRTGGVRADRKPWRIGIQPPDSALDIDFVVAPGDHAVATSGDYRNYWLLDGKRISHTIDPQTAEPVEPGLASVTVVDPLASRADALATALIVMGPVKGPEFAAQHEIPALFIVRDGDTTVPHKSLGFEQYLLVD